MSRQVAAGTIVAIVLTAFIAIEVNGLYSGRFSSTSYTPSSASSTSSLAATSQSSAIDNETIFIHVINSTSGEPVFNESVTAGPASSLHDIDYTLGFYVMPTLNECGHEVPSGAAVSSNGVVVSNGTTTTFAPCPLKHYFTNATGWVTISNQNASYYLIFVGLVLNEHLSNAQVVPIEWSRTYVTAFPEGNFTVSSTG
jgi:hypothetical protein